MVYLHSGSAGAVTGYVEEESFDATETGVSLGRYRKSTGSYNFVEMSVPTPGSPNTASTTMSTSSNFSMAASANISNNSGALPVAVAMDRRVLISSGVSSPMGQLTVQR